MKQNGASQTTVNELPPNPSRLNIRMATRTKTTTMAATTAIATWFPGDRRGGAQYGWGPYGGGPEGVAGRCTVAGWRERMMKATAESP